MVSLGTTTRESLWLVSLSRSSCPEVFYKKGVLKNFSKFTGKPQDIKYLSCRTSLLNCVPCVPAHQSGLRANVLASQRDLRPDVPKRANFLFLLVDMPYNVPTFQLGVPNGVPTFQIGVPACQNVRQVFKHSSYVMIRQISLLYFYIKKSTLYLIS